MNLISELRWRGMVQDIMPGTEDQLNKSSMTGYIGFDPTADSLHIGSLVQIILLVHLQKAGHKPLALVGGATGMVGDPSGKSEERNLLDEDALSKNLKGIQAQLEKFLDFDPSKKNAAEIVNNADWFKNMGFISFIRDVGKHITVNYMMAKDSVKKRLNSEVGMSFTEFTYQLIQGYDFYWLFKNRNCTIQIGGSDQWGNIVTGTELIRRKTGGEAFAFTCPLIKKSDGTKFGKTESGNIWLDPAKTSPYLFYQFWLNASDADAENWIRIFTFLDQETINGLIDAHKTDASKRILQKKLAEEVTSWVHGKEELNNAIHTTQKLFENQNAAIEEMSKDDLESIEGIIACDIPAARIKEGLDIISMLADAKILPSKGEAKKLIANGGVNINRKKVDNGQSMIEPSILLHDQYLLVQKGKKNYYLVRFV